MQFRAYLDLLERGGMTKLADDLKVSISYLSQLASGASPISPARCVEIESATKGVVTRKDLRPNDWAKIWPELAKPSKRQSAA